MTHVLNIFFYCRYYFIRYREFVDEIKVKEHSYDNFQSNTVLESGVIELIAVEIELFRDRNGFTS